MNRPFHVKPNLADRVVGWLSPVAGVERLRARGAMTALGGYNAGARSRRQTERWRPAGGSADTDTVDDLPNLRERSRDMERNNPLAATAIDTETVNVVGTGLVLQAQPDGAALGIDEAALADLTRQLEAAWELWAGSPDGDATRTLAHAEQQDLVLRSALLSGDVFAVKRWAPLTGFPFAYRHQLVEADRCSNPDNTRDTATRVAGVDLDADGAPAGYHFADRHPFDIRAAGQAARWVRVAAFGASGRRNVLHLFVRKRPEQTRGVPLLAPVLETLKQLDRFAEAELFAAVINACMAVETTTAEGEGVGALADGTTSRDEPRQPIVISEPGTFVNTVAGEKVASFATDRPSTAFSPFHDAIAVHIAAGLNMPAEVLLKRFSASYSASRAALEMVWQFWRRRRQWLARYYCQPTYEDVILEAAARGMVDVPLAFWTDPLARAAVLRARWVGPARISLDPARESTADERYLKMGATTLADVAASRFGADWEDVLAQRARERAAGAPDPNASAAAPAAPVPADPPVDGEDGGEDGGEDADQPEDKA
ncbi:MAG: phage portal protein [Vicinamibacterales bacterium]